jgi:hypothetical protein
MDYTAEVMEPEVKESYRYYSSWNNERLLKVGDDGAGASKLLMTILSAEQSNTRQRR